MPLIGHFLSLLSFAAPFSLTAQAEVLAESRRELTVIVAQGFSPGNAEQVVVDAICSAKKELRVAAYSFTSKPIAQALVAAHRRGVQVQVVLDKSQEGERYTASTFLKNQGVPVRINRKYAIMHNKFMVIDGDTVETGSFNYTSSAANKNAENVIVLRNSALAATYAREWNRLWCESEPPAAKTDRPDQSSAR